MKKFVLFLLLLFITVKLNAQFPNLLGGASSDQNKVYDGKILGIVIDGQTKKPVEFASVALYKTSGSKPLDGVLTDDKGVFKFKNVKNGKYKVVITFIGYLSQTFDSVEIADKKLNVDLGKINLNQNTKLLNEAEVEGQAPLIESKIDKLVYNNDRDPSNKGGNATDVLRKVPMVQVDLDGNVSLQGTQNVKVLINNKPSNIMAASVADAMKMIPSDEIEKVEVITSPSAKYDAEGTGGIINIITKKKNIEGLSGSVNVGLGTRSSNLYSSLNYNHQRMNLGVNVGGFGYMGLGNLSSVRVDDFSTVKQDGDNTNIGAGPFGQMNFGYDLNSKNSINASFRLNGFYFKTISEIQNNILVDTISNSFVNNINSLTGGLGYDANVDFKRTFTNPDQEFSISAQLTSNNRNTDYTTVLSELDEEFYNEKSKNTSNNRELTFQTDYTHPFTKKTSLEVGAKAILRDVISDYNYDTLNYNDGIYYFDSISSNVFDYTQNIAAGYAQIATGYKKWGLKVGGRYEYTKVESKFDKDYSSFSSDYDNFIPFVALSYAKLGKYSLKLAYTKRIQRPSMTYLNPYINNSDPTNVSYGNPNLQPEESNSFELAYNLFRNFGSINTSVFHRYTNNAIESYRFIDTTNSNTYTTTYGNIGSNYSTGASMSVQVMWKMKLIIGSNSSVYYYKVETNTDFETETKSNDGINYSIGLFCSYKFNDKWGVQTFGTFTGPKYSIQGKSTSFFYYNLSARREFAKGKGGFGFGFDNFATPYIHFKSDYSGEGFTYNSDNKIFFLGVRVSFDYRFGKMSFGDSKKKKIKNDDLKKDEDNGMGGGNMGR